MRKYDVYVHASKHQGFEEVVQQLKKEQREHKDALVFEARKILEAGGINQELSKYADGNWSVHVTYPDNGDKARVSLHLTFAYCEWEGEAEWSFSYDELANADLIAHWIDEQESRKVRQRKVHEAERAAKEAARLQAELEEVS